MENASKRVQITSRELHKPDFKLKKAFMNFFRVLRKKSNLAIFPASPLCLKTKEAF
jgi:hypothetical protein